MIDNAERSIDMAAYVLSDPFVIEALRDAADRGVTIRLYLDKSQYSMVRATAARSGNCSPSRTSARGSRGAAC